MIKEFVNKKLKIARCLYNGQCNATYVEAMIILSSILSGIASEIWQGKGIDRKRFVELCIRYNKDTLETDKLSIPLLLQNLYKNGDDKRVSIIKNKFPKAFSMFPGNDTLVITGKDVDLFENEVSSLLALSAKELRQFSYANLFYEEVRCGLVHEYQIQGRVSTMPMGNIADSKFNYYISYVNVAPYRQIHFSYEWIEQIILSAVENPISFSNSNPNKWWIDG